MRVIIEVDDELAYYVLVENGIDVKEWQVIEE
jgi:hypothetical protein